VTPINVLDRHGEATVASDQAIHHIGAHGQPWVSGVMLDALTMPQMSPGIWVSTP